MLKALIIDDEPLAHEVILHHLRRHQDVDVVGQCHNATQALAWLANNAADLLFLDINMPALNGMDMLKVLAVRPLVIVVTAYQDYAVQGFELDVADYLVKPVAEERLAQALDKVRRNLRTDSPASEPEPPYIVLKVDRERRKFLLEDISLLEAYGNFVKLWRGDSMTLVTSTLKDLQARLPVGRFTRVHKSFVVNNDQVAAVDAATLTLHSGRMIKIGKSFKQQARRLL